MAVVRWILVLLYGVFIFIFAGSPESGAASMSSELLRWFPDLDHETLKLIIFYLRKFAHIAGYFIATMLIYFAVKITPGLNRYPYLVTLMLGLLLAILDEWYQTTLPHRTGAIMDVFVDLIGIILALSSIKLASKNSRH